MKIFVICWDFYHINSFIEVIDENWQLSSKFFKEWANLQNIISYCHPHKEIGQILILIISDQVPYCLKVSVNNIRSPSYAFNAVLIPFTSCYILTTDVVTRKHYCITFLCAICCRLMVYDENLSTSKGHRWQDMTRTCLVKEWGDCKSTKKKR